MTIRIVLLPDPGSKTKSSDNRIVRVNVRFVWGAFVSCCFACGCVLELVVCRVRFARVSCPWLRLV